ncbi:hypothetical protein CBOM_02954 [Ceraceosorus bombacis]|uniref:Uncharacterized protein n=1 Tax=Ceraceosorus bombacis TaxID=401625 RepID=A0A0P1BGD3_9BASI|nr:hypothetical protein CBOM_02954 [Ceraceosorus bombacis]
MASSDDHVNEDAMRVSSDPGGPQEATSEAWAPRERLASVNTEAGRQAAREELAELYRLLARLCEREGLDEQEMVWNT